MTLKQYADNINAALLPIARKHGLMEGNEYPFEYLKRKINEMRGYLARETRCIEEWLETPSVENQPDYSIPITCWMILDVWYDTELLRRKNPDQMNYLRAGTVETGVPIHWSDYGVGMDSSAYVYFYPTPSDKDKVIKIQGLFLPDDITLESKSDPLPIQVQWLVEEGVKIGLLSDLPRTDPRLPIRQFRWDKKVASVKNFKVK